MTDFRRPFGPEELPPGSDADLARSAALGRELERLSAQVPAPVAGGFSDRVMAAIAAEPLAQPAVAGREALRRGRLDALLVSIRDAWRVAFSPGRPAFVRVQALAIVLVAMLAVGSVGTMGAVGALNLLGRGYGPSPLPTTNVVMPSESIEPSRSPSPSLEPAVSRTPSPSPDESAEPGESEAPAPAAGETNEPGETETAEPGETEAAMTPRPSPTPTPTPTPTGTDEPDDTPDPGDTPDPDDTPSPTDESSDDSSGPGSGSGDDG